MGEGILSRGAGESGFRVGRGFDGVDVAVVGAGLVGVAAAERFEDGADFEGVFGGLAVGGPELSGVEVHERFGVEDSGVEVVGVALHEGFHGGGARDDECFAVGGGIIRGPRGQRTRFGPAGWAGSSAVGAVPARPVRFRVAAEEGFDVGAFAGGGVGEEARGAVDAPPGKGLTVGLGGLVVVGAEGLGDAPVGHGGSGVECGGGGEGAGGFVVFEAVADGETPLKELLGRAGGGAEAGEKGRGSSAGRFRGGEGLGRGAGG